VLVPAGDVAALARALDELAADPAARKRMSEAARDRAVRYLWPDLAGRVAGLYDGLVTTQTARARR
jgi:glycosyltransferase involved in cell wall biosynthesis